MKLRAIEEMCARTGLRIVRVQHSKRIKVTVQRNDGVEDMQVFPRTENDRHAIKNKESALRRFAQGSHQ